MTSYKMLPIEPLPLVQARDYLKWTAPAPRSIQYIVIHDMEYPERKTAAMDVGKYFQHPDKPSSAHVGIDNLNVVRYVADADIAYAAPGCNHNGIQVELAGYSKQQRGDWLDNYSYDLLCRAGIVVGAYCAWLDISPVQLTNAELLAGIKRGIVGHYQVSAVFKKSDHTDPGPAFPWDFFLREVDLNMQTFKGELAP